MADVKISALPVATSVVATDVAPVVHAGITVQATSAQMTTAALNATPVTIAQGGTGATTASNARTALGLGTMATQNSDAVAITGGTESGVTLSTFKTQALTGYLYGNDTSGIVMASTTVPFSAVSNQPYIEVADTTSTIVLGTTPTLLIPTTVVSNSGITYDNTTGVFTFAYAGSYSLSLSVNARASQAGVLVYIYAENNTNSGWVVNTNSGKAFSTVNNDQIQVGSSNAVRRVAGQQVRYYISASVAGKITLSTTTIPGSTAIVPTTRIQYA